MSTNTPNPYVLDDKIANKRPTFFRAYDTIVPDTQKEIGDVVVNHLGEIFALSDKDGPKAVMPYGGSTNTAPITEPADIIKMDRYKNVVDNMTLGSKGMERTLQQFLVGLIQKHGTFEEVRDELIKMAKDNTHVATFLFSDFGVKGVNHLDPAIAKGLPLQQDGISARTAFIQTLCHDLAFSGKTVLERNKMNVTGATEYNHQGTITDESFEVGVAVAEGAEGLEVRFVMTNQKEIGKRTRRVGGGH